MTAIAEVVTGEIAKAITASLAGAGIKGAGRLLDLVRSSASRRSESMPETEVEVREFLARSVRDDPELQQQLATVLMDAHSTAVDNRERGIFLPPVPFCDREALREGLPRRGSLGFAGPPGTGKTALVRQLAVDQVERFPLLWRVYVDLDDLRMGDMLRLAEVKRIILGQLDITDIAAGDAALERQYECILATRHLLLVLDNALSGAEVDALVRPWPAALVLVTTRDLTRDLQACGPHWIELPGLDVPGAIELLETWIPEQAVTAERAAVVTLLNRFERHPHAINVIGSILKWRAGEPDPVANLSAELEQMGIDELDDLFEAVLSGRLARVPEGMREQFCLLALCPAGEFTLETAGILLGPTARRVVDRLRELGLIEVISAGRYRMSWSVSRFAAGLGTPAGAVEAMDRLLAHYAGLAVAADLAGDRPGNPRMRYYPVPQAVRWPDGQDRMLWLDVEAEVLGALVEYAYVHGRDDEVAQLCGALELVSLARGRYELCLAAFERGVLAAQRQGALLLLARQYALCGRMATLSHRFDHARTALDAAREIASRTGDPALTATIEEFCGRLAEELAGTAAVPDRLPAIEAFARALEIDRRHPDDARRARGIHARMLANVLIKAGRAGEALPLLREAIDCTVEDRNASRVYVVWAKYAVALGDLENARANLSEAQRLAATAGSAQYRVEFEDLAAEIDFRAGEYGSARSRWGALVEEFTTQGHPRRSEFMAKLSWLPPAP